MENKGKFKKQTVCSRREFLRMASGLAASSLVYGACQTKDTNSDQDQNLTARQGLGNLFKTSDGRPILVCVEGTDLQAMLRAGFDALGGLNKLLAGLADVLIKPNLNSGGPYPAISSVDFMVELVRLAEEVFSGSVYLGDMGWSPNAAIYQALGLQEAVSNVGGDLKSFIQAQEVTISSSSSRKYSVYSDAYKASAIINSAPIKRHHSAWYTCALKNMVGTITGPDARGSRAHFHRLKSNNFLREIANIAALIKPELNVIDARSLLTVSGPFYEQGVVVDGVNKVIMCGDIVATDVYCAQILEEYDQGFSASMISPTLASAVGLGLGTNDLSQVEIREITV